MALLNFRHTTPPDGWKFLEPKTSVWIWAEDSAAQLVDLVIAHRTHKGIEPIDRDSVWLDIQRQICSGMSKGWCSAEDGENYEPFDDQARGLTADIVLSASKTGMAWIKDGCQLVDAAEMERRAAICRACPFNRPSPSWVCASICNVLDKMVPDGRKPNGLHICGICSCSLRMKVNLPMHVITPENVSRGLRFPAPPNCWQSETG